VVLNRPDGSFLPTAHFPLVFGRRPYLGIDKASPSSPKETRAAASVTILQRRRPSCVRLPTSAWNSFFKYRAPPAANV